MAIRNYPRSSDSLTLFQF